MWPRAKCPSSCASTASISAGVRRSMSVSKKTMRLLVPKRGRWAFPWLDGREPPMTKGPCAWKPQRSMSAWMRRRSSPSSSGVKRLKGGEQRRGIEALIERCGFHAQGLFVMDGSRRSSHGNAYFTGFGTNKRIVFFDTLIERLTPAEIEAVLAHELGHFARGHIPRLLTVRFAL